jgi:hypothetical protein
MNEFPMLRYATLREGNFPLEPKIEQVAFWVENSVKSVLIEIERLSILA